MLRSIRHPSGLSIIALDGEIGKVHSFFFDDSSWTIRYLVVDTGRWLPGRKVLISPTSLGPPDWKTHMFPVTLTREQVRSSPDIDTDKPVSRQREVELRRHYHWAPYWGVGYGFELMQQQAAAGDQAAVAVAEAKGDTHLRSTREVRGYRIHATDAEIGHIEDFIVSDEEWIIRYLVADVGTWLAGRKVLISPNWVRGISWDDREVWVDVTKAQVETSPPYNESESLSRRYESQVHDVYGHPKYWE